MLISEKCILRFLRNYSKLLRASIPFCALTLETWEAPGFSADWRVYRSLWGRASRHSPSLLAQLLIYKVSYWDCSASGKLECSRRWQLKPHRCFIHVQDVAQLILTTASSCSNHELVKLDYLLLHVGWEMLSKGCLRPQGNGMAALPVCIPTKGCLEFGIRIEFLCLHTKHHAVNKQFRVQVPFRSLNFSGLSFGFSFSLTPWLFW